MRRQKYRRLGIATLDQVTSSLSNVLLVFSLARVSDVTAFGKIGLALAAFSTALAASRGLLGTPIALLSHNRDRLHSGAGPAMAAAVSGGALLGLVLIGATITTEVAGVGIALGLALPLVLAQDVARYAAISDGHPGRALASDSVWAAGGLLLLGWTWLVPDLTRNDVGAVWAALSALALAVLLVVSPFRPRLRGAADWWHGNHSARLLFGGEAVLGAVTTLVVMALIALILAPSAVAALRGAGSVMGPLSVFMSAVAVAVVPELRRDDAALTAERAWRHLRRLAMALSAVSLFIGAVMWLTPASVGALVLGETWPLAHAILPITAAEYAALSWATAAASGLKAQGRSAELLRLRVILTILTLLLSLAGALMVREVWGASIGLALAAIAAAVLGRRTLLETARFPR